MRAIALGGAGRSLLRVGALGLRLGFHSDAVHFRADRKIVGCRGGSGDAGECAQRQESRLHDETSTNCLAGRTAPKRVPRNDVHFASRAESVKHRHGPFACARPRRGLAWKVANASFRQRAGCASQPCLGRARSTRYCSALRRRLSFQTFTSVAGTLPGIVGLLIVRRKSSRYTPHTIHRRLGAATNLKRSVSFARRNDGR